MDGVDDALKAMTDALGDIAVKNAGRISGLVNRSGRSVAEQSALIAAAIAAGEFEYGSSDHKFHLDSIARQTRNLAAAVATLIGVAIQAAFDAIMGALLTVMRGALGAVGFADLIPAMPDS